MSKVIYLICLVRECLYSEVKWLQKLLQIHYISGIARPRTKWAVCKVFITNNDSSTPDRTFYSVDVLLKQ